MQMEGDGEKEEEPRLTQEEFETQFKTRIANEIQVFTGAMLRLDKNAEKNQFMKSYIIHVFRSIETSFITPKGSNQCLCQTMTLSNK